MVSACVSLEPFVLRVLDDSMAPDVPPGAVVIVDPGEPPEDGRFVVLEHDGGVLLRQLKLEAPRDESGVRARFVARAGPDLAPDGEWREIVRGVVTGVRLPRGGAVAAFSRGLDERPGRRRGR